MLAALKRRFRFGRAERCELGRLPDSGRVSVRGKAAPKSSMLKAPITGRSCVHYQLDVYEWQNGCKSFLLGESSDELFKLDDASGSVLVDAKGADAELHKHRMRGHMSYKAEYLPAFRKVLARHGLGMTDEYGELRSLEFVECLVVAGESIEADGELRLEADPGGQASYRELPQARILGSGPGQPLFLDQL